MIRKSASFQLSNTPRSIRAVMPSLKSIAKSPFMRHRQSVSTVPFDNKINSQTAQTLKTAHYFTLYSSEGPSQSLKVYLTQNLSKIALEAPEETRFIPIQEISNLQLGFSSILTSKYLIRSNLYGFRVQAGEVFEFSSTSVQQRNNWIRCLNNLLNSYSQWNGPDGFRKYWTNLVNLNRLESQIKDLVKQESTKSFELNIQVQAVKQTLESLITQVQIRILKQSSQKLQERIRISNKKGKILKKIISDKENSLTEKHTEIFQLNKRMEQLEKELKNIQKQMKYNHLSELSGLYMRILEFLNFKQLLVIKQVSTFFRDSVDQILRKKQNWKRLAFGTLEPRELSWNRYIKSFYPSRIREMNPIDPQVVSDIDKDVCRGLPDLADQVKEVLIKVSHMCPQIGYCQGMQMVAHFLLKKLIEPDEVLKAFVSLMRAPFHMGSVWKQGFPRLKIGIFQLKFLMKLKLPILSRHFKEIDLKLDVVVTSWILTIFTHLQVQQGYPVGTVEQLWDYYLVNGWAALVSGCLGLLDLSQQYVLGEDIQGTLIVYTSRLPSEGIRQVIGKYQIEQSLLDDLERAYYLQ